MKLKIPKFRYLAQDKNGAVRPYLDKPYKTYDHGFWVSNTHEDFFICDGEENSDWYNTLIDLEVDDYEFTDGILRRVEK